MKTLLLALISPNKSKGTREGAIRGLMGVGKEAVRKGLVDGGGAKVVGSECGGPDSASLIDSVMVGLFLHQGLHRIQLSSRLPLRFYTLALIWRTRLI